MYADPQALHLPLDKLAKASRCTSTRKSKAGAAVGDIFDTVGGVLTGHAITSSSPLLHAV